MGNNLEFHPLGKTSESIPDVGMGTWGMGGGMRADSSRDSESIEALKLGLELDMTLVDTAEMYGAGHSEEVVSRALEDWRKPVFVASKVSPSHFGYDDLLRSARKSLERLRMKKMDLYQLHWPNPRIPIAETMKAMEKLVKDGVVRNIGVSNFTVVQIYGPWEPRRFLKQNYSKDLFCVAGKIFFVNFRKRSFAVRNVSGRDYPFFAQNKPITRFSTRRHL